MTLQASRHGQKAPPNNQPSGFSLFHFSLPIRHEFELYEHALEYLPRKYRHLSFAGYYIKVRSGITYPSHVTTHSWVNLRNLH